MIELLDPDAPGGNFTHWLLYGIDGTDSSVGANLPAGSLESTNGFGNVGYGGPCPPARQNNHYHLYVIAVDTTLRLAAGADLGTVDAAKSSHALGKAELVATYFGK